MQDIQGSDKHIKHILGILSGTAFYCKFGDALALALNNSLSVGDIPNGEAQSGF